VNHIELRLHLTQRDQGEDWLGVLIRPESRVGPQLVGCLE
jgi:hypothetical protein